MGGIPGTVGLIAEEQFSKQLAERLRQELADRQAAQQEFNNRITLEELGMRREEAAARLRREQALAAKEAEEADRIATGRRASSNVAGLLDMPLDPDTLELESAKAATRAQIPVPTSVGDVAGNQRRRERVDHLIEIGLPEAAAIVKAGGTPTKEQLMTPAQKEAERKQHFTDVETESDIRGRIGAKYQRGPEPDYEWVTGPDGEPRQIRKGSAQPGDKPYRAETKQFETGANRAAIGYYNRMKDANDTMEGLEDKISEKDILLINNSPLPDLINNRLLSSEGQQYAQALMTYTEARLRKESGAAIAPHEFYQDRKTIGRQVSDTPDTIKQKRKIRKRTAEGVAVAAGPAYEAYYGEPYTRVGDEDDKIPVGHEKKFPNGNWGRYDGQKYRPIPGPSKPQ